MAVRAVVLASQEGVRPEEAMLRVVDAVLGGGAAKGDNAGGGGSKQKGKEKGKGKEAQKKRPSQGGEKRGHEAVKHVACVCM